MDDINEMKRPTNQGPDPTAETRSQLNKLEHIKADLESHIRLLRLILADHRREYGIDEKYKEIDREIIDFTDRYYEIVNKLTIFDWKRRRAMPENKSKKKDNK